MVKKLDIRVRKMWASQYVHGEHGPGWYRLISRYSPTREDVAFLFAIKSNGSLLDVGCGEGRLLINLSKYYKKLVGIDILDYRIKRAIKNANDKDIKNISLRVRNIENGLGFSPGSFDAVICLSVIEYTFDPYFTAREIAKVLKKGGTLILSVPNVGFVIERLRLLFGKIPNIAKAPGWQGGRLHNFTQSSLSDLLQEEGLEVVEVVGSGFLNKIRSLWPSLLCGDLIFVCRKK